MSPTSPRPSVARTLLRGQQPRRVLPAQRSRSELVRTLLVKTVLQTGDMARTVPLSQTEAKSKKKKTTRRRTQQREPPSSHFCPLSPLRTPQVTKAVRSNRCLHRRAIKVHIIQTGGAGACVSTRAGRQAGLLSLLCAVFWCSW